MAALLAGCSADSTRLSDPFSNPFATASNDPAPPPARVGRTIPAGRTPPVVSQALPPATGAVAGTAPLRPYATAYNAPVSRETTGSIEPGPSRSAPGSAFGGWTSSGGVGVTVGEGESVDLLSKRYGVPPAALLQTNGLRTAADVRPGTRLTIPVYNAVAVAPRPVPQVAAAQPVVPARTEPVRHAARAELTRPRAERLAAAATREPARPTAPLRTAAVREAEPAKPIPANDHHARKQLGKAEAAKPVPVAKAEIPVAKAVSAKAEALVAKVAPAKSAKPVPVKTASLSPAVATEAPAVVPVKAAAVPVKTAAVAVQAAAKQPDPAPAAPAAPVTDAAGSPEFRWPAHGRIIQGFKNGNDGINIAVPEGTSVKAAETGTVAYAGSELKGYGNLVLIRHPNGYVTAYANNGELDVKRGDQVKRGQVIAKSGQSGNVSSPQLHFELRKGSQPVDPTSYLAGL